MESTSSPVKFANRNSRQLFGILHTPDKILHHAAIILLSPGIKSRVAPHRMYIGLAYRFCKLGFVVLRLDPEGLGDAEGEIEEKLTADVYGSMELGRLVNDTIDAMNWMESKQGFDSFILAGLCGGAITGLLAGANDRRVAGLLGLGITCVVSGSHIDPTRYITKGQLDSIRIGYLKKLMDPASWRRFLSAKSDYRLLAKSLATPLLKFIKKQPSSKQNEVPSSASAGKEDDVGNLNPLFPPAFFRMVADRRLLLIFSEADRLYWEYREKFEARYSEKISAHRENLEIRVVENANHIFSFPEWKAEMLELSCSWLNRYFPE